MKGTDWLGILLVLAMVLAWLLSMTQPFTHMKKLQKVAEHVQHEDGDYIITSRTHPLKWLFVVFSEKNQQKMIDENLTGLVYKVVKEK